MAIYLVQHGKNLPKDVDPEKGLSEEGKKEVERVASAAKRYGLNVASIRHSGKKRALETATNSDSPFIRCAAQSAFISRQDIPQTFSV